jgi:hypothetical protein
MGSHTEAAQYNPCMGWKKIMLDHRNAMADADKRAIINHDCYGYRLGCWMMPPQACEAKQ